MATDSGHSQIVTPPDQRLWRRVLRRPGTRLGRWAVALATVFVALFAAIAYLTDKVAVDAPWRLAFMLSYVPAMLLTGLAAGATGLLAVLRRRERSWMVWLAMLIGLFALLAIVGEILEYLIAGPQP